MAITEILVHVDDTPATEARLRAAVELAAACKAHVSALTLITEPFMRALVGRHLPEASCASIWRPSSGRPTSAWRH